MSVDDSNSIDVISTDPKSGDIILTVSDHLDWSDTLKHQKALQAKLNAYLRFVESGEILREHPNAQGRRVVFDVVLRFPPDQAAREFLGRVRQVVESAGVGFRCQLFAASFDN